MSHELLASGRDADIFDAGPGLVLRRSRDGRSLAQEAEIMEHVRQAGFPAPRVEDLRSDGTELLMQRLHGPSMMHALTSKPTLLPALARSLADLHCQLGAIPAPHELRRVVNGGSTMKHLDLHPLNVIITDTGPFVIDWTNAAAGRPENDVASTWVLIRSSEIPGSFPASTIARCGRRLFLRAFLKYCDKEAAAAALPTMVALRLKDPNLTSKERQFLDRWSAELEPELSLDAVDG